MEEINLINSGEGGEYNANIMKASPEPILPQQSVFAIMSMRRSIPKSQPSFNSFKFKFILFYMFYIFYMFY